MGSVWRWKDHKVERKIAKKWSKSLSCSGQLRNTFRERWLVGYPFDRFLSNEWGPPLRGRRGCVITPGSRCIPLAQFESLALQITCCIHKITSNALANAGDSEQNPAIWAAKTEPGDCAGTCWIILYILRITEGSTLIARFDKCTWACGSLDLAPEVGPKRGWKPVI
jgi:hypothetical protein